MKVFIHIHEIISDPHDHYIPDQYDNLYAECDEEYLKTYPFGEINDYLVKKDLTDITEYFYSDTPTTSELSEKEIFINWMKEMKIIKYGDSIGSKEQTRVIRIEIESTRSDNLSISQGLYFEWYVKDPKTSPPQFYLSDSDVSTESYEFYSGEDESECEKQSNNEESDTRSEGSNKSECEKRVKRKFDDDDFDLKDTCVCF